jgi:hypothetical protein
LRKGELKDQYGEKKGKQVAYALATMQGHRLGKTPKTFKSKVTGKKEPFGTREARVEAKLKYDQPRKAYRKTASEDRSVTMLSPDAAERIAQKTHAAGPYLAGVAPGVLGAIGGGALGTSLIGKLPSAAGRAAPLIGAALGAATGAAVGAHSYKKGMKGRNPGRYERRMANKAIRAARAQGYDPVVQDSWLKIDRGKVRGILRQDAQLAREAGVKAPRLREAFKRKEGMMVPPFVQEIALDILEKQAKFNLAAVGQGLKKGVKKVVGEAPGKYNPLDPGSGVKGLVGRIATPM